MAGEILFVSNDFTKKLEYLTLVLTPYFAEMVSHFNSSVKIHSTLVLLICCIMFREITPTDEDVNWLDTIHKGEIVSGCLCPTNALGTYRYFCGHELKPQNSTIKCAPEGTYRCTNSGHFAVQELDCNQFGKKCIPQVKTLKGEPCETCKIHTHKLCRS